MASAGRGDPNPTSEALDAFVKLFSEDSTRAIGELPVTLDRAALAIARVLQPHLDVEAVVSQLDDLAATCPAPTREAVVQHVLGSDRLVGDRENYSHWHNSCIDRVIARGKGMPITLAVVTTEVARRVGVPLVGVGMPGHFLVGDARDPNWFADPFDGGTNLDADGCRAVFARTGGNPQTWRPEFLLPTGPRDIVIRILNNLKATFTSKGDPVRLALVMRMRLAIPELDNEEPQAIRALAVFN